MKLDDCPVPIYGNPGWRGECPMESLEQVTFFNRLRTQYPGNWGVLAIHPRNEQQLRGAQHRGLIRQKAEGMSPGAADIVIPGSPAFVCEIKRRDRTRSKWQDGQREYLEAAMGAGCFVCVALGCDAAWEAFEEWRQTQ